MTATFRTGEIADALGLCVRTVCKWCDAGAFPSFRLPGGDRRVYADTFRAWCESKGIRYPAALEELERKRGAT